MEKKKTQVFIVHGGMTFKNQEDYLDYLRSKEVSIEEKERWSDDYLKKELEDVCHVIKPRMPLKDNAKYEDWKIYFERFLPQLEDGVILIGSSLGGIFLAKYLSENMFPKKISSVYLVAPPFDNTLTGEDLVGGFDLGADLSMIEENCKNINLLFSEDDDCVPIAHAEKYKENLKDSNVVIYDSKNGHFRVSEFPEIVEMIRNDLS